MIKIILKKGKEKSLLRRHPWVFSGAVDSVSGEAAPGETISVQSADGSFLGFGAWSPHSQIRCRIWSFERTDVIGPEFFRARIDAALALRRAHGSDIPLRACRVVNAENDGLPGLIVDRYGDFAICQFLAAGPEYHKDTIVAALTHAMPGLRGVYERSDADVRIKEGLPVFSRLLWGEEPPETIDIDELGVTFRVDVRNGHKTGFYLDQRDNRRLVGAYARGREVLNCFCYTGGFGVWALAGGAAHVLNIDTSGPALDMARANVRANGLDMDRVQFMEADVFKALRAFRDEGRTFDLIVLDPPKFVDSKQALDRACRGYKDINLLAFQILRPGGTLFTYSCSGLMDDDLFQKVVAGAALDAGRQASIIHRIGQAPDHPVRLSFPEGRYLKGFAIHVE
ncbi:23S rRNA (cytosine1962-C5)-methyltransferase [Desulfobaculum xiamenense]|uniref:23S rRNA (Cytosine1962-C5)-methyltransferase n=1 Tax=Desulfobaculum xiamenense TaxID=995050 RepID=A0A846QLH3_9BACT|nr:class I SAM-dependent methyltransferase [Desulfobaculum xiamenense]NJB68037.1 23S rRNA (cytosine1962-C5)-methyltransferase [Desulfobaculum xiamenense]